MPYRVETNLDPVLMMDLKRKYGLKRFVETGTASGGTAMLAAVAFDQVDTVELWYDHRGKAVERLRFYPWVHCEFGESPAFLRALVPLKEPALFWLDAHWCGGPRLARECPLLDELKAIGGLEGKHVVVIDDTNFFLKTPVPPHRPEEWPKMDEIRAVVARWHGTVHELLVPNNVMVLTPTKYRGLR